MKKYYLAITLVVIAVLFQIVPLFASYIPPTSVTAPLMATSTRALNTAFQISSTNIVSVTYAVDIAATLSLTSGQSGTVVLEYADDSAFTTNVTTVQSSTNGNSGALTIGLNLVQTTTATLTGYVPAGKYVRLRTVNTTGTPTFTFKTGQEVTLLNI